MTELWVATTNRGKFKEIKELLKPAGFDLHGAFEMPSFAAPHEGGATFEDNAKIKARYLHAIKGDAWILSDDSGLEVAALKNLPGVHSARYAGPTARDIENTLKVLKAIQLQSSGQDRAAKFRCAVCLISPTGEEQVFTGELSGQISRDMRGTTGFGYDPIFIPEGETKTIAELGLAVKHRLSHRAQAVKAALAYLMTVGKT